MKYEEITGYKGHKNQLKIHESKAKYRTVVAGRRFGKSALALNEAIVYAGKNKRQIVWIVLPLYRQAKEIYWIDPDITKYFMPLVQAGLVKADKSELSLYFHRTNSWIRLKGSDNYDSLRGSGIDLLIWDEVADVKEEAFQTIEPALADSPDHRQLFIGTPKGLNWFHDFALKGDHKKQFSDFGKSVRPHKDWMSWHFTSYDNMAWPKGSRERRAFVEYIDDKREEAEEKGKLNFWNQEYMASFEEAAGRFFPIWSARTHVANRTIIPREGLEIYESMDWGRTAPFAWHAHIRQPVVYRTVQGDDINFNRIYTFAELYGSGKSPHEWIQEVLKMRDRFGYKETKKMLVDPSMFDPLSDGSTGIKDQMQQAFDEYNKKREQFEKGTKNRVSRWGVMDNWMREAIDGLPYWMITKDCPDLIRTIPLQEPDENNIEDLNTELEDHAVDGVSYFLPIIKWIDSGKLGTISRPQVKPKLKGRHAYLVDPTKFKK